MDRINNDLNKKREIKKYGEKIKKIKKGVIFVIVIAGVITASNAAAEMQHYGAELARERAYRRYENDEIEWETYNSILETLEMDQFYYSRLSSVVSGFAKVVLHIGFLKVILGFLSISADKTFTTKMRRTCLILSAILLLGMLYLVFNTLITELVIEEYYYRW